MYEINDTLRKKLIEEEKNRTEKVLSLLFPSSDGLETEFDEKENKFTVKDNIDGNPIVLYEISIIKNEISAFSAYMLTRLLDEMDHYNLKGAHYSNERHTMLGRLNIADGLAPNNLYWFDTKAFSDKGVDPQDNEIVLVELENYERIWCQFKNGIFIAEDEKIRAAYPEIPAYIWTRTEE